MKDRQQEILNAIVREYQRTGQPVSSAVLTERYDLNLSPATIRAEMMDLDERGFLKQPYTSAGRVPTDKALRFFIEEFGEEDIDKDEKERIRRRMGDFHQESLRELAQFLADCSGSLGISVSFGQLADFHGAGLKWLVEEPEFEDDAIKNIMRCFDSLEEDFNKFFNELDEETEIFIGHENPIKYLRNYSLVVTAFENDDGKRILGILGPKRMDYRKNKFVVEEAREKAKKLKSKN